MPRHAERKIIVQIDADAFGLEPNQRRALELLMEHYCHEAMDLERTESIAICKKLKSAKAVQALMERRREYRAAQRRLESERLDGWDTHYAKPRGDGIEPDRPRRADEPNGADDNGEQYPYLDEHGVG